MDQTNKEQKKEAALSLQQHLRQIIVGALNSGYSAPDVLWELDDAKDYLRISVYQQIAELEAQKQEALNGKNNKV